MARRWSAVYLVSGVLAAGWAVTAVAGAAAPRLGQATGAPGDDPLAATLQWSDVARLVPSGGRVFWPELPQFNTGLEPGLAPLAEVVATYDYVGSDAERAGARLVSTVIVYPAVSAAASTFASLRQTSDAGGKAMSGPPVDADRWRYFRKPAGKLTEWTLRWRIGVAVGRVSAIDNSGFGARDWTATRLAALFRPVARRVQELVRGRLHAPPLPAADLRLLPAAGLAPGPALGTAKVPAEAWAAIDSSRDPQSTLRKLTGGGVGTLLDRAYLLEGVPRTAVGVVLFRFDTPAQAATWTRDFIRLTGSKTLAPGRTGATSAFTSNGGDLYELQFAHGRYVGDVGCGAPFGTTPSACEAATRTLAEKWYAALE